MNDESQLCCGSDADKRLCLQSITTLGDGRVFVIGGSWNGGVGNKTGEARTAIRLNTADTVQPPEAAQPHSCEHDDICIPLLTHLTLTAWL